MIAPSRPYRSVLYIPGAKQRALEKAQTLATDAIIFDLEDAVSPDSKSRARSTLREALQSYDYGARSKIVRINALDTNWGKADAAAIEGQKIDAVLLPKVNGTADVDALAEICPDIPIWAMIETPLGVLNAAQIAAHKRIAGFVAGTNDLAKELGVPFQGDRMPMISALQNLLLAAKAHGVIAIDGVYNAFKNMEGLRNECRQGRAWGFDGKTLIHPAQLEIANTIFAPSEEELALAREQIAAFEAIQINGEAVAVVRGQIVENLHIESARALLTRAAMIAAD